MMESSKTCNYHICDILYNLYEDNIFQNQKEIKFFSITNLSFIKDTSKFGYCKDLINVKLKPYHISTLKIRLDKVELKTFFHDIDEQCLITLLKVPSYQNRYKDNAQEQLYGRRF